MIIFRNPGLIDINGAITLGVSVKEGLTPIGRFGTGFKFGVATILREGGSVTICRGGETHVFGTERTLIRDKEFNLVTLDGVRLGFTTDLGIDWKPWMAFRELACNALDEGGRYYSDMGNIECGPDETMICVQGGGIEDAYHDRHDTLLEGEPIYKNHYIEVRPGETNAVYFRGVRVGVIAGAKFCHRYNILPMIELTEDRTFKWEFEIKNRLSSGLQGCEDRQILKRALTCGEGYVEHALPLNLAAEPSRAFIDLATNLRAEVNDVLKANPAAMTFAKDRKLAELGPRASIDLNHIEAEQFDRAKRLLAGAGFRVDEYPIVIVDDLGAGVLGMTRENKVFVSRLAFSKGTREVAATLIEEYAHIRSGAGDATRGLQNWLFDQLLCQIELNAGESF